MRSRKRGPRAADVPLEARELLKLPNVGPATALDLVRLGISTPAALVRRDPEAMYEALCAADGVRHDPCVRDVFAAIVDHASGAAARPWWAYTPLRKRAEARPR